MSDPWMMGKLGTFVVWVVGSGTPSMLIAISGIRLKSSSGFDANHVLLPVIFLLLLGATASWALRCIADSPTDRDPADPGHDLSHLGPELGPGLEHLIFLSRTAAACLQGDPRLGERQIWELAAELESAPSIVRDFLATHAPGIHFRALLEQEAPRTVLAHQLGAFEHAIVTAAPFGYR